MNHCIVGHRNLKKLAARSIHAQRRNQGTARHIAERHEASPYARGVLAVSEEVGELSAHAADICHIPDCQPRRALLVTSSSLDNTASCTNTCLAPVGSP